MIRVWEVCPSRGAASAPSTPLESDVPLDGGGGGGGLLADPAIAVFQQRPYRCAPVSCWHALCLAQMRRSLWCRVRAPPGFRVAAGAWHGPR